MHQFHENNDFPIHTTHFYTSMFYETILIFYRLYLKLSTLQSLAIFELLIEICFLVSLFDIEFVSPPISMDTEFLIKNTTCQFLSCARLYYPQNSM